ncbi:MAG TPA: ABC transporter substrate-binding protein [Polyangiaceae bacterium]
MSLGSTRRWCTLGAACLLAGCGREGAVPRAEPGILTVVAKQEASWVRNFNPLMVPQSLWGALGAIYEPLMTYNVVTGEYEPLLATSYRWEKGNRRLVFEMRKGVTWSDGVAFTAKDAAFTFRLLQKFKPLDQHGAWTKLESVAAVDDDTLAFEFKKPFVPGLFMITQTAIVPQHLWKDVDDPVKFTNDDPVGTGPLTEVALFQPQVYQLEKNPNYWDPGKPKIKGVKLPAFPTNDQSSLALIHGEVDWAGSFVPAIDRIFVGKDREHRGYFFPRVEGTVILYTNTRRQPLGDVRVRKALSMAIDREKIVKVAMHGYTRPSDATGLSDLYAKWKDPEVVKQSAWVSYDPQGAARLLDAAGVRLASDGARRLPNGKPFAVEINCVAGWSDWILAAQIIVKNYQSLGIVASLKNYSWSAWYQRLSGGEYDLSLSWSSGDDTPYEFYRRQMSTDTLKPDGVSTDHNWQRFGDPEVDRLLRQFEGTSDADEQRRISRALQQKFVDNAPSIPLFPGLAWGEYNSARFKGFPTAENPYAPLSPHKIAGLPNFNMVLRELEPL